ncbi:MAG: hypothetical protein FWE35_04130 [Streptosporangiales bacterium]|jgi:predicted RNA-binding protein with PUA domain|nr:hypothetical protein [Streptosporangiales bacterium]
MSCEHLICANCNGPVVEGRCAACREAKARVHHHPSGLTPQVLIAIALIAVLCLLLAAHVLP